MDVDVNVFFILIGRQQKMNVYYSSVNVYIHIILNVNMMDLLLLVGQTLVVPWKSLSVTSMASFAIIIVSLPLAPSKPEVGEVKAGENFAEVSWVPVSGDQSPSGDKPPNPGSAFQVEYRPLGNRRNLCFAFAWFALA